MTNFIWLPSTLSSSNRLFDQINSRMITVGRNGVSNMTPDVFLNVQFGVIGWKIIHFDFRVLAQEVPNFAPLMPRRPIYVEIDLPAFDAVAQIFQEREEALSIAFRPAKQTVPAVKRFYPSEKIESFVVLACSGHDRLRSSSSPDTPELRMQRETALVREDQQGKFAKLQDSVEFFLSPRRKPATPSSVACIYPYIGCLRAKPSRLSQLRACRGLSSTLHTLCRNSTTTTPSHRVRRSPNSSGDFVNASASFCCAAELTRVGRPERCSSRTLSSPRLLALRIQSITACRLIPKSRLMAVDFQPLRSNRRAAILMPFHAPGILSAFCSKAFSVIDGCVTFRDFMHGD
jgi:hypothetical protein